MLQTRGVEFVRGEWTVYCVGLVEGWRVKMGEILKLGLNYPV